MKYDFVTVGFMLLLVGGGIWYYGIYGASQYSSLDIALSSGARESYNMYKQMQTAGQILAIVGVISIIGGYFYKEKQKSDTQPPSQQQYQQPYQHPPLHNHLLNNNTNNLRLILTNLGIAENAGS